MQTNHRTFSGLSSPNTTVRHSAWIPEPWFKRGDQVSKVTGPRGTFLKVKDRTLNIPLLFLLCRLVIIAFLRRNTYYSKTIPRVLSKAEYPTSLNHISIK
jgi:hypothetical protein